MTQTAFDLRTMVINAKANPVTPEPAPAPARRFWATTGQQKMISDMHFERFPADEAARIYSEIDWEKIDTRDKFQAIFQALKDIPRIDRKPKAAPVEAQRSKAEALMEGVFTVEFEDGSYKTLRVRRQKSNDSFMPGTLILGFLSGSNNESDYTNFGHVTAQGSIKLWKRFAGRKDLLEAVQVLDGDQVACAKAYARRSRRCSFCRLPLTTPESLDAGWGEKCANDRGLPWG